MPFDDLAAALEAAFTAEPFGPWSDDAFAEWALRCFAVQFEENGTYRALCESRGVGPGTLARWEDAPMVPAAAFKQLDLITGAPDDVEAVFRTSGTTGRGLRRGRHLVRRLDLYRASALPNFAAYLLPGGESLALVSLIPSPEQAPDSSLSAMMGMVGAELCSDVRWVVDATGALDLDTLRSAAASDEPLLVAGTAFAFVHLLDRLGRSGRMPVAPGTRLMETGGFKGRVAAVSRDSLYQRLSEALDVPRERIVNEYGMTELLSQLYEPVLREGTSSARWHVPAPWLRVRALDPVTLAPVEAGRDGLLAFFDLANLGSVCHVLTEDVGSVTEEGVRLRGRAAGAEPRGCSRAMDDLMSAAASVG